MEPAESSGASTPPEREPVMDCRLVLTALSGATINVSLSIAKFDRFEDLEDHVMDYLVSATDLKVFGCSIEFLHMATQTYLDNSVRDRYNRPVSVSSREEVESSPTQASELTALSAATVTSPTDGEETSVHEVSSIDSQMQVDDEAEDKEEEVATEDPTVEQEVEHDEASVYEVNDSSSVSPCGHPVTEEEIHSQSAETPRSEASTRYQANEQLDVSPTGEAGVRKGLASTPACPGELPVHCNSSPDRSSPAEGDCPSSCPPTEQTGAAAPGVQSLKGIRLRWQQASLARATTPSEGVELTEGPAYQRQQELEGRGTFKAAAAKHSAVKSKPSKPLAVLQSIAESTESTLEHEAGGASRPSTPCGHTGLVSLAETPIPTGIKEDPRSLLMKIPKG